MSISFDNQNNVIALETKALKELVVCDLVPEKERFVNGIAVQIYRFMYDGKLSTISEGVGLGDVILGSKVCRESADDRICFIAGGMPVWDVAWGTELYENAKKLGLGQKLLLWDEPALG